jgi:hypothetical protein
LLARGANRAAPARNGEVTHEILARVWAANETRLLGDGVPGGDVNRARASLERWPDWFPYWTARSV